MVMNYTISTRLTLSIIYNTSLTQTNATYTPSRNQSISIVISLYHVTSGVGRNGGKTCE